MATIGELAKEIPQAMVFGDKNHVVTRVVHPTVTESEHDLFFLNSHELVDRIAAMKVPKACAIVDQMVWQKAEAKLSERLTAGIVSPRPRFALAKISAFFPRRQPEPRGIHPSANIDPTATIGENCVIGAGVCIGANASIGEGCVIQPNVTIGGDAALGKSCRIHAGVVIADGVRIGNRVIVQPNAVIGGDGFAFDTEDLNVAETSRLGDSSTKQESQTWERIESFGSVNIGDDVEIGAGTTIDRATVGETLIDRGTKIDNLVQIGHNCRIGEDSLLCAQVGLAGSTTVGRGCVLAGKVGVADHLKIGDFAVVMAKSGVTRNLEGGSVYYGMPARPVKETLRIYAAAGKLGDLRQRLADVERQVAELSQK